MMRIGLGKSTIRILAVALTTLWLCSGILSSAIDDDSLRAEIAAVNSVGNGTIALGGDIILSAALPPIAGSVTIDGGGHTISGNDAFRIFDVNGGALTLKDVVLTEGNAADGDGGAIRMRNGARVTIERSTLITPIRRCMAARSRCPAANSRSVTASSRAISQNRAQARYPRAAGPSASRTAPSRRIALNTPFSPFVKASIRSGDRSTTTVASASVTYVPRSTPRSSRMSMAARYGC